MLHTHNNNSVLTDTLRKCSWAHLSPLTTLRPPYSQVPGRVFEFYLVLRRPPCKDGLLGDEAVAAALRVLMDPVHLALTESVLLIVMVRDTTVTGSAVTEDKTLRLNLKHLNNKNKTWTFWFIKKNFSPAVAIINHSVDMDAVTHVYGQDHCEKACTKKCPSLHSEQENKIMLNKGLKLSWSLFFLNVSQCFWIKWPGHCTCLFLFPAETFCHSTELALSSEKTFGHLDTFPLFWVEH